MTFTSVLRRALPLGIAGAAVAACDLADFVNDPKPIFEQTWNLPAPSTSVSVASLLPPGQVTILPDSSAFSVSMSGAAINARVGDHCAACEALNGTNAPKPQFNFTVANSTALPTDIVSAAVTGGQVDVQVTNNMSFDPIFVNTAPGATTQGFMAITVRSGSLVLGVDTVKGEVTPWPSGSVLDRVINFTTGVVTGTITVDVTVNSPLGDHNEFINANGTLNATASVPTLNVASVSMNVPTRTLDSQGDSLDLSEMDEAITDHVVAGELRMTITNPFPVSGNVFALFQYGPNPNDTLLRSFTLPSGAPAVASVSLDSLAMSRLFGNQIAMEIGGTVSSTSPITVTPTQAITMDNRLVLTIRTGK